MKSGCRLRGNGPPIPPSARRGPRRVLRAFARVRRNDCYPNVAHPALDERARGPLARFAGAEQEHFARLEMTENLFCKIHGYRADGNRPSGNPCPGADLLCDSEGALKKSMQKRSGGSGFARRGVGFLGLAKNFGLADHHRVEPGCDSEKMLDALLPFVSIKRLHFIVLSHHPLGKQATRDPRGRDRFFGGGVNFHPVAGGEEERLRAASFFAQDPDDLGVADEPLARLDICGVMAEADTEEIHYSECVCERKVIPQSNVSAALNATTQRTAIERGAVVPR